MINQFQAIEALSVLCDAFIIPSTSDREIFAENLFLENDFWQFLKKDTMYLAKLGKLPFYRPDIIGTYVQNGERMVISLYELV